MNNNSLIIKLSLATAVAATIAGCTGNEGRDAGETGRSGTMNSSPAEMESAVVGDGSGSTSPAAGQNNAANTATDGSVSETGSDGTYGSNSATTSSGAASTATGGAPPNAGRAPATTGTKMNNTQGSATSTGQGSASVGSGSPADVASSKPANQQTYGFEQKTRFREAMQARLRTLDERIDNLKRQTETAGNSAQAQSQIVNLESRQNSAESRLQQVDSVSKAQWDQFQAQLNTEVMQIEQTYQSMSVKR